jgi:hypothetical protein
MMALVVPQMRRQERESRGRHGSPPCRCCCAAEFSRTPWFATLSLLLCGRVLKDASAAEDMRSALLRVGHRCTAWVQGCADDHLRINIVVASAVDSVNAACSSS